VGRASVIAVPPIQFFPTARYPARPKDAAHARQTRLDAAGTRRVFIGLPEGLPFPAHLNVDIDGSEVAFMAGANRTLSDTKVRAVIIELLSTDTAFQRILDQFRAYHFELNGQYPIPGNTDLSNFVFVRDVPHKVTLRESHCQTLGLSHHASVVGTNPTCRLNTIQR
jgi:hypothetical protein